MAGTIEPTKTGPFDNIKEWPQITRDYFADLQLEMKRVTWPTRQQVQATTAVVIITVFAFAVYFYAVDKIIEKTVIRAYTSLTK